MDWNKLRTSYRNGLPKKIDQLNHLLRLFSEGNLGAEAELRAVAHTLAGSGGSYGFDGITQKAREVERADEARLARAVQLLIEELNRVKDGA